MIVHASPPPRALSARSGDWFHPGMTIIDRPHTLVALIGKRLVISVFRRFVLSLSQPELARFSRDYVIFHKPHLQSQSR